MPAGCDPGTARRVTLASRRATIRLARSLGASLAPGDLVVLSGPLGVGKTFLVRALCRALGVPAHVPVTSPSYAIVHEHVGRIPVLHVDLYRLGTSEEVEALGLGERRPDSLLLVEWGRGHEQPLGGAALEIELSLVGARRGATLWLEPGARRELADLLGRLGDRLVP